MPFERLLDPDPKDGLLLPYIHAILQSYKKYGVDPIDSLKQANIDVGLMHRQKVSISMTQLNAFVGLAIRELDDEGLGWFSRPLPLGTFGFLARGSLTAPNLMVALKRWVRHQNLLTQDVSATLSVGNNIVTIAVNDQRKDWECSLMRELSLMATLRCILGFSCWLVDGYIETIEMGFPFGVTENSPVYTLLFDCPVCYDQQMAYLRFDGKYLSMPNMRNEDDMPAMLRYEAQYLTSYRYRRNRIFVSRVRELLSRKPEAMKNADVIADALHVSIRTLHRHLQEEGTTLQALKNEARHTKAEYLLSHTLRPIKQIATTVGFGNEKSFIRAFKQSTGESPADYRQRTVFIRR